MSYRMYIFPTVKDSSEIKTAKGYDVSEIAHNIQYTTSLKGYPGKLTFVMEKDTSGILKLECGYAVAFMNDDFNVFFGYIFTLGTDRTEAYKVTAYDQMRYLQNHDYLLVEDGCDTLNEVFKKVCTNFALKYEIVNGSDMSLKHYNYIDVTGFDILNICMDEASLLGLNLNKGKTIESTTAENLGTDIVNLEIILSKDFKGDHYFIRDRFGKLELNEIRKNAKIKEFKINKGSSYISNLPIIGDESLLTDYQYEISIDKDTYNTIEFLENIGKNKSDKQEKQYVDTAKDETTIKKWGVLKQIRTVHGSDNKKMFEYYKNLALESANRVSKSITLKALGIDNLYAGDCFVLDLKKLNFKEVMYVTSATHNYEADIHTMSLEVNQSPNLTETLK